MHKIPDTFCLDHLLGRTLTSVSFGQYDLHFLFAPKDDILCVGKVVVEVGGQSFIVMEACSFGHLDVLAKLPGRKVVAWTRESNHEFSVDLSGAMKLRFISTDSGKEEFVIFPGVQVV